MKILIILASLIMSFSVFSKGITVNFICLDNTPVNIYLDEKGKVVFEPDVFSSQIPRTPTGIKECVTVFQENASQVLTEFKKNNCPSSKDPICFASIHYTQTRIAEKINKSDLVVKPSSATEESGATPSAQIALEEKILSGEMDTKNLRKSFKHQGKNYKVSDFDSVIGDNIENIFMDMTKDEAAQYAQNYMVAKTAVLKNASDPSRSIVMGNLDKMFGYIHGENAQAELSKAVAECTTALPIITPIVNIIEKLDATRRVLTCRPVNPGEHKVFKRETKNYYSTGSYLLKRRQDGNYQAVLNVNFVSGAGSASPQAMLARAKGCLAEASPFMKGPNGEQLEITLLSPKEIASLPRDERPAANKISIEGPNHTNNAGAYSENINCATITHEMLHLFGLCDEYGETRPEYMRYGWSCRVVTKVPSLMRDLSVYQKAVGGTVSCNCSGATCSNIMRSNDPLVRKLYTANTFYDLSDHRFRTSYCKEEYLPFNRTISSDKITNILQNDNNLLVVESRYLYTTMAAPYYNVSNRKITCRCPSGDRACENQKAALASALGKETYRKNCPREAPLMGSESGRKVNGASFDGNVLKITAPGEISSLLLPNHFNKILEGNCPGKADGYRECAEFAYKGEPCNVPAKCQDDRYYLGSQK